jgi:hypothetical protein
MSPDPYDGSYRMSNPQSFNRYGYVLNNPLGYVDPWGLYPQCITVGEATTVSVDGNDDVTTPAEQFCFENGAGGGGGVGGGGGGGGSQSQTPPPFHWTPPIPNKCLTGGYAPSLTEYQSAGSATANSLLSSDRLQRLDGYFNNASNLMAFHRGGALDAQAYGSTPDYANYAYGVYMSAGGFTLQQTLEGADLYAGVFGRYSSDVPIDTTYKSTPAVNVKNISNGYNNQQTEVLPCPTT